ncbi:MAG: hypothetical protein WBP03_01545 [Candidatus Saccharimonadales bacterium]
MTVTSYFVPTNLLADPEKFPLAPATAERPVAIINLDPSTAFFAEKAGLQSLCRVVAGVKAHGDYATIGGDLVRYNTLFATAFPKNPDTFRIGWGRIANILIADIGNPTENALTNGNAYAELHRRVHLLDSTTRESIGGLVLVLGSLQLPEKPLTFSTRAVFERATLPVVTVSPQPFSGHDAHTRDRGLRWYLQNSQ